MRRMRIALRGSLYTVLALAFCLAPLSQVAGVLTGGVLTGGVLTDGVRTAHAEEDAPAEEKPNRDTVIDIGTEPILIEDFLRALSRATQIPLVWNPTDKNIRNKRIFGSVAMNAPPGEFFALARSLLTFYELVMIPVGPKDNQIMLVMDARATSSILKLKPVAVTLTPENLAQYEHADGLFITCAIPVKHMQDLRNARNALTRIVTGQNIGNVTEVPAAKTFVVTDFAPNVVSIYRLLMKMDIPSASASTTSGKTEAIWLEYGVAPEMAAVLQAHFSTRLLGPGNVRQANARSVNMPPPGAPRITADARTNKLLVTGTDEQITKVKAVIARLDLPVERTIVGAHYVRLKHIYAPEVAATLMTFVQGSPGIWSQEDRPSIVAHEEANALLISATRRGMESLLTLITNMDVAPKPEASKPAASKR